MAWWMIILLLFYFMVCFLLIVSILVQAGKGGGLSSLAGGGGGISETLGATGAEKAMNKVTTGVAVSFMVLAIIISVAGNKAYEASTESEIFGEGPTPAELGTAAGAATGATILEPSDLEGLSMTEIPADFAVPVTDPVPATDAEPAEAAEAPAVPSD